MSVILVSYVRATRSFTSLFKRCADSQPHSHKGAHQIKIIINRPVRNGSDANNAKGTIRANRDNGTRSHNEH